MVRVLFATTELAPVAAVGGLAQAAAGLTAELRRRGDVDVEVVLPDYGAIDLDESTATELDVPGWVGGARARRGSHRAVGPLTLIDTPLLARSHPYVQPDGSGWPDNSERFFGFAAAVAALVAAERPDVIHLNDWHTGAVLAASDGSTPSVLSLHNLAFQGISDAAWLDVLGPRADHFEWYGGTNPLSGAIALADRVVAVSPHHATEIRTPAGGFGLDGPLRARGDAVRGILNGIDASTWDPATDAALVARYSAADAVDDRLAAKAANRAALVDRLDRTTSWPPDRPVAVAITRLTDQKGIDLIADVVAVLDELERAVGHGVGVAVLGSGDPQLAERLRLAATAHHDRLAFVEGYDDELAHLMFGAGDLLLMPSRFEPCGLAQMQAMRYGTIPVVTDVGGLHDTVIDADRSRRGTGIVAATPTAVALFAALARAVRLVHHRRRRAAIVERMMALDWSWTAPAAEYVALYESLVGERRSN